MKATAPKWEWTDESVSELRRLHAGGSTFSEIAVAIGCRSRNAVIGKASRLGLASRHSPVPAPKPPRARPKPSLAPVPEVIPVKQNRHAGNIAKKADAVARERAGLSTAPDRSTVGTFDAVATVARPGAPGVLFLDRRPLQCAMPLPGWDDLPVTEKLVCGLPTVGDTSWCRHCLPVVSTPSTYREQTNSNVHGAFRLSRQSALNCTGGDLQP
ncbi:GcrA family cell cycle regulator [Boseaceae bacterium BT-24-1]|nr:GcrA family cell cycle regulator [Boseaceae bacterium BT-24-1]